MKHANGNSFATMGVRLHIAYDIYDDKSAEWGNDMIDSLRDATDTEGLSIFAATNSICGSEHLETDNPAFVGLPMTDIQDDETLDQFSDRVKAKIKNLLKNTKFDGILNKRVHPEVIYGY
jgi:hypothetical protein